VKTRTHLFVERVRLLLRVEVAKVRGRERLRRREKTNSQREGRGKSARGCEPRRDRARRIRGARAAIRGGKERREE